MLSHELPQAAGPIAAYTTSAPPCPATAATTATGPAHRGLYTVSE